MPNAPSQVVRDLNLNSGDAVELHIAADILRMAEGVSVTPGINLDVNRADAGLDSINRSDGLLDTVNRDFGGQSTVISPDADFGLDTEDRARQNQATRRNQQEKYWTQTLETTKKSRSDLAKQLNQARKSDKAQRRRDPRVTTSLPQRPSGRIPPGLTGGFPDPRFDEY